MSDLLDKVSKSFKRNYSKGLRGGVISAAFGFAFALAIAHEAPTHPMYVYLAGIAFTVPFAWWEKQTWDRRHESMIADVREEVETDE